MRSEVFKVGEIAEKTGLTVRALHHYDEIGLVRPSARTGSGHRLYTPADVGRLQRALSLKQLGFSLEEARERLDRPDFDPIEVIGRQVARLRERIALHEELCGLLEGLARLLQSGTAGEVSAERFFRAIEVMSTMEGYYTPEQMAAIKKRGEDLGPEAIRAVKQEWPVLIANMKAAMEAGVDPADPSVQALGARWKELVDAFTGRDPGIAESLGRLWKEQGPSLAAQHGMDFDPRLFEYVGKVQAAAKGG